MNENTEKRYDQLYDKAVSYFLDKNDFFNADEWLDEKDALEFEYYRELDNGDIATIENLALSIAEFNEKNPTNKIELLETFKLDI